MVRVLTPQGLRELTNAEDCGQNDDTHDHELPGLVDLHHLQARQKGFHQQRTDKSAENVGTSAGQRGIAPI